MSILIKGMEMPVPGAYTCELGVLDNNTAVLTIYTPIDEPQRSYRLVPVPPHGPLIVEDDAIETAWMILAGIGYRSEENPQLEQTVREVYATAPTIEVE